MITSKILLALIAILTSGCSICAPGYMDDYGGVGGKLPRVDPTTGRVGSLLSGAGVAVGPNQAQYHDSYDGEYYDDGYYEAFEGNGGPGLQGSDEFYEGGVYSDEYGGGVYEGGDVYYGDEQIDDGGVIVLGEDW
ncbi:hypothetical protein [Aureliella helgolandensis]|uniref:hypothetical protein n=1 Tax=Aureliella helgolandensis TaxID=2527968 RepID=UPI0011A8ECB9|nr:hypothetical protein [Aureliella helgolandensis]